VDARPLPIAEPSSTFFAQSSVFVWALIDVPAPAHAIVMLPDATPERLADAAELLPDADDVCASGVVVLLPVKLIAPIHHSRTVPDQVGWMAFDPVAGVFSRNSVRSVVADPVVFVETAVMLVPPYVQVGTGAVPDETATPTQT
jgi:hypothetical protein